VPQELQVKDLLVVQDSIMVVLIFQVVAVAVRQQWAAQALKHLVGGAGTAALD
jgi:hypothetical protein